MATPQQMEFTTFLEEKYGKFFRFLDVSNKGFLTEKTFAEIGGNVRKLKQSDDKAVGIEDVSKWWTPFEPLADDGRVDESRFLQVVKFIYSDREEFERFQINCEAGFARCFQATDRSRDGAVSREDLRVCYRWFGRTDNRLSDRVFAALDTDGDGRVCKVDFLEALHKYFFSNDTHVGCSFLFG